MTHAPKPRPPTGSADLPLKAVLKSGVVYTCPMHPQVQTHSSGACPICGMALERLSLSAKPAPNRDLADMTRRFWISLAFALPVFVLEMGGHLAGHHVILPVRFSDGVQFALSSPVVLWGGWPFFKRGWTSVRTGRLNMFTLISLSVGVAFLYSVIGLFAPALFPLAMRGEGGGVPIYFEASAMIIVLVLLGQMLELGARERTGGAIRALLDLAPRTAKRLVDGGEDEEVSLDQVRIGDRLRVRPGEKTPVDGVILEGRVSLDESLLTGESMPVTKVAGAKVISGAINRSGAFVMKAERVGADTLLSQIVEMVAQAQRSRAPIQALADRVSGWFVPAVMGVALVAAMVWWLVGPQPRLAYGLVAAVSVLIIACPCALGLATPISIMVGVGRGARDGLLIRNAEALERLERIDTLVVDKTGTLTEGRPAVTSLTLAPGFEAKAVLRLAASLERGSKHPLAEAILREASEQKLSLCEPSAFDAPPGQGVMGVVDGLTVRLGNARFFASEGAPTPELLKAADELSRQGATAVFVSIDARSAGVFGLSDPIKPTSLAAIKALQAQGVRVVMLTGDNRQTALAVAARLGLEEVEAEVLPADKARVVDKLKAAGRHVAMAGDGVNDAPALAAAEVGVAMGPGSDVAIESAGITLLGGDLAGLVKARKLSSAVMRNIRQNLVFAFIYNAAGVPIAAGVLYPALHLMLSPQIAAGAMALSSVSVITNALRLRGVRLT